MWLIDDLISMQSMADTYCNSPGIWHQKSTTSAHCVPNSNPCNTMMQRWWNSNQFQKRLLNACIGIMPWRSGQNYFTPPPTRLPFHFARGFFVSPHGFQFSFFSLNKKCRAISIFYLGDFRSLQYQSPENFFEVKSIRCHIL